MDTTMHLDYRHLNVMVIKPAIAAAILVAYFAGVFGTF